jgi:hypothetical protein
MEPCPARYLTALPSRISAEPEIELPEEQVITPSDTVTDAPDPMEDVVHCTEFTPYMKAPWAAGV